MSNNIVFDKAISMIWDKQGHTLETAPLKLCPHGQCEVVKINNIVFLKSYETLVAFYNASTYQFFIGGLYSMTTRKHITYFLREYVGIESFIPYKKYVGKALVNCCTNEIEEIVEEKQS